MGEKVHTKKCYCDIPREKLAYLVQQHFIKHVATVDLMKQMNDPQDKEDIAVVALLDVPRAELLKLLELEDPKKLNHWLDCHNYIRQQLAEEGLKLKGME